MSNSFVVTSRENNLKYVGEGLEPTEVNDYAAADLVIHKNKMSRDPGICMVIFERSGVVAEIKEDEDGDYLMLECMRNVSGVVAAQVVQALQNRVLLYIICRFMVLWWWFQILIIPSS